MEFARACFSNNLKRSRAPGAIAIAIAVGASTVYSARTAGSARAARRAASQIGSPWSRPGRCAAVWLEKNATGAAAAQGRISIGARAPKSAGIVHRCDHSIVDLQTTSGF